MEMSVTTPAILFPAISLLMLAYTNRFLALATLIRSLHANHEQRKHLASYHGQLANLRKRLRLIRRMQTYGGISFFFCVVSMLCLFFGNEQAGRWTFALSLVCLMVSLAMSVIEIRISLDALEIELSDLNQRD
ncbi:MAG: DUF2721 domain-containing protein [Moraxellaceae bacterium]|nr:DUF2721 domain-containing protein [Moraxellaceae bacterium]MCP5176091.1 DUF2721 domain-containing protein [Moraxellaceae bacterium]